MPDVFLTDEEGIDFWRTELEDEESYMPVIIKVNVTGLRLNRGDYRNEWVSKATIPPRRLSY